MQNSRPPTERVRAARDLALQRLGELQSADGSWFLPIETNAAPGAAFIILLRTTGLIEKPGQLALEVKLLHDMLRAMNPDGGFWKFPGAPSSRRLTLLGVTALRLALGEVAPGSRPANWYRRNPQIDSALEQELHRLLAGARHFLKHGRPDTPWVFELDLLGVAHLLAAHADPTHPRFRLPLRPVRLWRPGRRLHVLWHWAWPALNILMATGQDKRVRQYAARIRQTQDPAGGWQIASYVTMINTMALVKTGAGVDDPAVAKAHDSLLRDFLTERSTSATLAAVRSQVVNTGYGLDCCLRARTPGMWQAALAFLLNLQTSEGGFTWGNVSRLDPEADSTAHVLRGFPMAGQAAEGALRRGVAFMLAQQNRDGGFGAYGQSPVASRPGALGGASQIIFDMSTADVTGRVVEVLASVGCDTQHPSIRRALEFFLKMQCRNGTWWSRWWAGYLVGASFVLRAYGRLGLRHDSQPSAGDPLLQRSLGAMARAVAFVLQHQNPDGGWGETIRSDEDVRYAGQGDSTPLHTAHLTSTLLRIGYPPDSPVIGRAIDYLVRVQSPEGLWCDDQCTFTIFARCLYYRYEFLNYVLPLDALTDYLEAAGRNNPAVERTN